MDRNDINIPRFARSIRYALDDLAKEAHCYGWRDDPEYLEIKKFLERRLQAIRDGEPNPLSLEDLYYMPAGSHVWVKELVTYNFPGQETQHSYCVSHSAIIDYVDGKGLVAIWNAESLDDLFLECDYGKRWWAYLIDPVPEDDE